MIKTATKSYKNELIGLVNLSGGNYFINKIIQ